MRCQEKYLLNLLHCKKRKMSLTPFHVTCPYTNLAICRCEKYLSSKKEARTFSNTARLVYQMFSLVNPEYAKEFGLEKDDSTIVGPIITHRVTVNAKTAGAREPPIAIPFQGPPPLPVPQQRSVMQSPAFNYQSPQPNWMRFVKNPAQQTRLPPPLPQPTTTISTTTITTTRTTSPPPQPQLNLSFARTPFNNSNIKIISSNNPQPSPAPLTNQTNIQQRQPSPTPQEGTPRIVHKRQKGPKNDNMPKKRGRPRKRRVCENCNEGEQTAQDYGKDKNMLQCLNCKMCIHTHCHDPNLDHVPMEYRKVWRCEDCKICETCMEAGDENQLLICETCDRGFHTYCLQPPLQQIPKGSWTCPECRNPQPQVQYVQAQSNSPMFMNQFGQSMTYMQPTNMMGSIPFVMPQQNSFTVMQKENGNTLTRRIEYDSDDDEPVEKKRKR